jgi:hypothetical protein
MGSRLCSWAAEVALDTQQRRATSGGASRLLIVASGDSEVLSGGGAKHEETFAVAEAEAGAFRRRRLYSEGGRFRGRAPKKHNRRYEEQCHGDERQEKAASERREARGSREISSQAAGYQSRDGVVWWVEITE